MKNQFIKEIPMFISKTSLSDEEMRWSAVSSDVDWDLYDERMSLELYKSMILKIKANAPPPEPFKEMVVSDYWQGGMPYLSIAHFSDANGKAVPGDVLQLFVDGKQLKSKGTLFNNKLGQAVWKSLKQDEINYKTAVDADRIRISIAFLDLAHKHGENGEVFERKSLTNVCPECLQGKGQKIYLDGYLVHLALTRVPVNPRTIMEIEDPMARKAKPATRKEDAESVLNDKALADQVAQDALENKSDVLVEMSEAETEVETPTEPTLIAVPALVEEANTNKEKAMEDEEELGEEEDEKKKNPSYKSLSPEDVQEIAKSVAEVLRAETTVVEAPVQKSALDISMDNLYNVVESVKSSALPYEEKLQAIQPVLEELGSSIVEVVKSATPVVEVKVDSNAQVLEAINNLASTVKSAVEDIATIKAQQTLAPSQLLEQNRVPVPRSIVQPVQNLVQKSENVNPNSLKNQIRRSTGLPPVAE